MVMDEQVDNFYFRLTLKNKTVMKRLFVVAFAFILSATSIFAQKAGKGEAPKPDEYYSCPNHSQVTSHEPGKCSICGTELSLSKKEIRAANTIRNYTCPAHMDVVTHNPGKCPKCGRKLNLSAKEQLKSEVTKVYTCPMHPEVALDKDGVCPKCGKALVEKKQRKKS
jgi:transcription initiation factor IIE alpha subunit